MTPSATVLLDRISGLEDWLREETDRIDATIKGVEQQFAEREPLLWQNYVELLKERIDVYAKVQKEVNDFKEQIKPEVLSAQETIRGVALMAVYSKPATTWNGQKLAGYAVAHPEVMQCANIAPQGTVSFRKV